MVVRGRDYANSISDAEQLLCILYPATALPSFRLDRPDETAEDVLDALGVLGGSVDIPKLFIRVATEYMEQYTCPFTGPVELGRCAGFDLGGPCRRVGLILGP